MLIRTLLVISLAALLPACGGEEEMPACCAIEPKAKCESDLLGAGVSREEIKLLMGPAETICPSATTNEARIRELAQIWSASDSCKASRGSGRLRALDSGLCSARSIADGPPIPDGVNFAVATACAAGLVTRGVTEPELWLVLREPAGVCPNSGVTEKRLRDIIAKDWGPAGCPQFKQAQMLNALDSGACGGDAG